MAKEWGEHCEVGDRHTLEEITFHCSEVRRGYATAFGEGLEAGDFVMSSCLAKFDKADAELLGVKDEGELEKFRVRGVRRLCIFIRPAGRKTIWQKTLEFRFPS